MIRSLLLSSVASVALVTGAMAADLPNIKGPPVYAPPPPPVFSWTGFYVGLNAGLSAGNATKTHYEDYGSYPFRWETTRIDGFSGGGQIGYNWEGFGNNIVVGVEADFQGSTLKGTYPNGYKSYSYNNYYGDGEGYSGYGSSERQAQTSVDWWGTVRGRVGYAFGNVLPYVTGGFAYGRVQDNDTYQAYGAGGPYGGYEAPSYTYSRYDAHSYGGVVPGWTAGAGLEYAITPNLTVKAEYLFVDLANLNHSCANDCEGYYTNKTHVTFNTVRAGLNWKFDWLAPPAPVVAKY
jgi:outer membrane immunogenic protein